MRLAAAALVLLVADVALAGLLDLRHPRGETEHEIRQMSTYWMVPFYTTPDEDEWGVLSGVEMAEEAVAATGSWGGVRDRLHKHGIHIGAEFFGLSQGNPVGGKKQTSAWSQVVSVFAWIDLEDLVGWKDTHLLVSFDDEAGTDLSNDIGSKLPVTKAAGPYSYRLGHLAVQQYLADEAVDLVAGRIDMSFDFAFSPNACFSVASYICPIPQGLSEDYADAPIFPITSWGGRARISLGDAYLKAGAYETSMQMQKVGKHGVEIGLPSDAGVAVAAQLGWDPERALFGKPGSFAAGGIWDSNTNVPESVSPSTSQSRYAFYGTIDQQLTGAAPDTGLAAMLRVMGGPPSVNAVSFYTDAGLMSHGLIPTREKDVTALYLAYMQFGSATRDASRRSGLPAPTYELGLELTYVSFLTDWLAVQPDVQGIVRPGGSADTPNALVLGLGITVIL